MDGGLNTMSPAEYEGYYQNEQERERKSLEQWKKMKPYYKVNIKLQNKLAELLDKELTNRKYTLKQED